MKKLVPQITMGIVALILGVMITFQFKLNITPRSKYNIREGSTKEIESLKKQKEELAAKVDEYQKKVNEYEQSAADVSSTAKKMKDELEDLRKLSGLKDVEGPGIVITVTPNLTAGEGITDMEVGVMKYVYILDVINELNSSTVAEAISINDERFTSRTQIWNLDSDIIKINDARFNASEPFVFKVIGQQNVLEAVFKIPGNIADYLRDLGFKVDIKKEDKIKILKYNKKLEFKYIK